MGCKSEYWRESACVVEMVGSGCVYVRLHHLFWCGYCGGYGWDCIHVGGLINSPPFHFVFLNCIVDCPQQWRLCFIFIWIHHWDDVLLYLDQNKVTQKVTRLALCAPLLHTQRTRLTVAGTNLPIIAITLIQPNCIPFWMRGARYSKVLTEFVLESPVYFLFYFFYNFCTFGQKCFFKPFPKCNHVSPKVSKSWAVSLQAIQ